MYENENFKKEFVLPNLTFQIVFLHIFHNCTLLNNICFLLICCKCFISVLKRFPQISRHLQRIRSRHSVRSTEGCLGNEGVSRGCTKILSTHPIHKANVTQWLKNAHAMSRLLFQLSYKIHSPSYRFCIHNAFLENFSFLDCKL